MKRTIFYSWQSDLQGRTNRNLIEDALKRAIRAIARDQDAGVEPVLDRDTANLAGTPDIAQSILAKIATADIFVADVSIVSEHQQGRPTPNPNVLIELGYAVAELGWENVVLVMNSAYGGPEQLPFDLRGRRTVVYEMRDDEAPAEARGLLQGRLESCLRGTLSAGVAHSLPTGPDAALWWGRWHFDPAHATGGRLFIRETGATGFLFELDVFNGAHQGRISSYARILSADLAYCRVPNGPEQPDGELVFRRGWQQGARTISIEEAARCSYWGGMRANFSGEFRWQLEPWFQRGYLNELELARLYGLVGEGWDTLKGCTADMHEEQFGADESVRVIRGGVAGLYTIMESIVMLGDAGRMWVAYIDDTVVRYFTNVFEDKHKLPAAIEAWRVNLQNKEVRYCEPAKLTIGDDHSAGIEDDLGDLEPPTRTVSSKWRHWINHRFRRRR
ncbi:nucleotide-binding protein [Cyanobium sp. Candia 9D4]|uniref:TIR domain-containing protein n=1 Tax=Cyanobium sp. Candia 9D4 TaxID=2823707 RepID=UPI0020CBF57B|nr:TIR domain-containing protein [Cyanobium sp. Candia 9D4]MCP9935123.1 nucleotide-binding protein [Cyanobium sp. Candia 9D4]